MRYLNCDGIFQICIVIGNKIGGVENYLLRMLLATKLKLGKIIGDEFSDGRQSLSDA